MMGGGGVDGITARYGTATPDRRDTARRPAA